MKLNSINQQNNQKFSGIATWVAKNPKVASGIAALAGSSVVAQKVVMTGSEATIGPMMDIGIGRAITNIAGETDNRTNESSRVQAIRTFSQSVGGTITGVIIRLACIALCTKLCAEAGKKAGSEIGKILSKNVNVENVYEFQENASKWGKNVGGALATAVMLVTNFIIDAPFINWVNKQATNVVNKISDKKAQNKLQAQEKEVK